MTLTINVIFFAVMIILHYCKKVRLSNQWVMIITVFLLPFSLWGIGALFETSISIWSHINILTSLPGLFVFGYQNIYPSDNWSFNRYYTEKAKMLLGGRRLMIAGFCGAIAGALISTFGFVMLEWFTKTMFDGDSDILSAATAATLGLNIIIGIIGAMGFMIFAIFGAGCFVLGDIMLTNGLIRNNLVLMEKSGERVMHIVLSSVPVVNIVYGFVRLKAANAAIKAENLYAEELLKGENR